MTMNGQAAGVVQRTISDIIPASYCWQHGGLVSVAEITARVVEALEADGLLSVATE